MYMYIYIYIYIYMYIYIYIYIYAIIILRFDHTDCVLWVTYGRLYIYEYTSSVSKHSVSKEPVCIKRLNIER